MILVVNTGSSSLKYALFDKDLTVISSANYAGIGSKIKSHNHALAMMLKGIADYRNHVEMIGHRVVHGGSEADEVMPVTLPTIKIIEKFSPLAPHHNPPAEKVIRELIEKLPLAQHFAVFDTAFFKQLPLVAKTYPIDKDVAKEYGIVRYGFHGISHEYVAHEVDPGNKKKIISLHLGAGCSIAAIDQGQPVDTSMGFTPLEGLVMRTRSGDLDPSIVMFLTEKLGSKNARDLLENHSGLAGMTGTSGSMFSVLQVAGEKIEDDSYIPGEDKSEKNCSKDEAALALEVFCYRAKKYIGSYAAALGGIDIVAFTGRIGYGSSVIRNKILSGLKFIDFSTKVVKPDEELAIAKKLLAR